MVRISSIARVVKVVFLFLMQFAGGDRFVA